MSSELWMDNIFQCTWMDFKGMKPYILINCLSSQAHGRPWVSLCVQSQAKLSVPMESTRCNSWKMMSYASLNTKLCNFLYTRELNLCSTTFMLLWNKALIIAPMSNNWCTYLLLCFQDASHDHNPHLYKFFLKRRQPCILDTIKKYFIKCASICKAF